jgi:DNA-binding PadR family transcriptional regulator
MKLEGGTMERELLLLGLLREEEMHGYQLNEFIDSHLGETVYLKKPTAYRLLNKMASYGWVTYREEQEGNRPPRRVYALTAKGESQFQKMLRENLVKYEAPEFSGNVGILFLHALSPDEAATLLRQRRESVEELLQQVRCHDAHDHTTMLLLLHQTRHLETELEWLDQVITELESGWTAHGSVVGEEEPALDGGCS